LKFDEVTAKVIA